MFPKFSNTREYHTAKKEWLRNQIQPSKHACGEVTPGTLNFLDDLDMTFNGKQGVLFSLGTSFYQSFHVAGADDKGMLIGQVKLLIPHFGTLVVVFDDLQGMVSGGYCLTKSLGMKILPGFRFEDDFTFECTAIRTQTATRYETKTRVELREAKSGRLAATSEAVFVRTAEILANIDKAMGHANKEQLWERTAPLRLRGEHPEDETMSFVLAIAPVPNITRVPAWWGDERAATRFKAKPSPFEGRMEIYNVEFAPNGGVRAVVRGLLTSEGAPGLLHGGAAGSICIEVLQNLIPDLKLASFHVRFKRPVPLHFDFAVEWTASDGGKGREWTCLFLDFDKNVLQEVVLREHDVSKI